MSKQFSDSERVLLRFAAPGGKFIFAGSECVKIISGKPTSPKGEPKTDLYIEYQELKSKLKKEIKVSYKQENADFLENKISKDRAQQILGLKWSEKISRSLDPIQHKFRSRKLIYKSKFGNTHKGSFTLGWKFELFNKQGGELSGEMLLSIDEIIDIYSGTNLEDSKKNSYVNSEIIANSGVASHMLCIEKENISSLQDIIDNIVKIDQYIVTAKYTKINFACKALNYRSFQCKYDGDRPLAVSVNWSIERKKLSAELIIDQPLQLGGHKACESLTNSLAELKISNTDEISTDNLVNYNEIVFE